MGDSWEDKYLALRDEHNALKLAYHAKAEEVKQTNVQLTKIENLLKMKEKMDTAGGVHGGSVFRAESDKLIKKLYDEKASLEAKVASLTKAAASEKAKRNDKTPKRRVAAAAPAATASPIKPAANADVNDNRGADASNVAKLQELTSRLGQRLESAEQQLTRVREENFSLKQQALTSGAAPRSVDQVAMASVSVLPAFDTGAGIGGGGGGGLHDSQSRLQRDLHDTRAKLQLLQTRYDHLEAKARAQTELQQGSYDQLEGYNRRIRELRRALQEVQLEKSTSEARASRAEELEIEAAELRQQNEKFEAQIRKLCESPFISSAYDKEERMQRLTEYERNERSQQLKIEHLQETAHNHHAALVAMKHQCEVLKAEKEAAVAELEGGRIRNFGAEQRHALAPQGLCRDYDVEAADLEQALTIVRRRAVAPPSLGHLALEPVDAEEVTHGSVPAKMKELYDANQGLQHEVDRAEAMLKAQLAINRELHLELEQSERQHGTARKEADDRVRALEAECARFEGKLRTLEAERKQRLYDMRRRDGDKAMVSVSGPGSNVSLRGAAQLDSLGEDLGADENLVEVWVRGAALGDDAWEPDTPTFAIIDFFNFESEATPVLEGKNPLYDFASSYRVAIDDFFFKFLATESLVVEVCKVRGADFELIGRTAIRLHGLLRGHPVLNLPREAVLSARDGSEVGTLHVEVRLGKAVEALYQLFLDNHPEERQRIDNAMDNKGETASALRPSGWGSKLHNELEVLVHSASGLSVREGTTDEPPTAFVHFQVLHFPDSFTRAVPKSREPLFEHIERFPMPTNPQMLALLAGAGAAGGGAGSIEFTVLDDQGDDEAENVGTCHLSVAALAAGDTVHARLPVVNDVERVVGQLNVTVRWRHAFRVEKELGPRALSAADVHELLSRFSPNKDGQVAWRHFLAWADPPVKVAHAITVIRECVERLRVSDAFDARDLFDHLNDHFAKHDLVDDERTWKQLRGSLTADELEALFHHLDPAQSGLVDRSLLIHVIQPATYALTALESKVRTQLRGLRARGVRPAVEFGARDPDSTGCLTRSDFKAILRERLDFELVDELQPPPLSLSTARHDPSAREGSPLLTANGDDISASALFGNEQTLKRATFEGARLGHGGDDLLCNDRGDGLEYDSSARLSDRGVSAPFDSAPIDASLSEPPQSPAVIPLREVVKEADYEDVAMPFASPEARSGPRPIRISVSAVEDALFGALGFGGLRSLPELRSDFDVLARGGDTVLKKQFLHVVNKHFADVLNTPALRADLLSFFASSDPSTEESVLYRAFLVFCDYQRPLPSEGLVAIELMAVHKGSLEAFRARDPQGRGVLAADDFTHVMEGLGLGTRDGRRTPVEAVARLFGAPSGGVDYAAFVSFALEHGASARLAAAEASVRAQLRAEQGRGATVRNLRSAMRARDRQGTGVVVSAAFGEVLQSLGVSLAPAMLRALEQGYGAAGGCIQYEAFSTAIEGGDSNAAVPLMGHLASGERAMLRERARCAVEATFERLGEGSAGPALIGAYRHYDFRLLGVTGLDEFVKASLAAGFLFTRRELTLLAQDFLATNDYDNRSNAAVPEVAVHYERFLTWATPGNAEAPAADLRGDERALGALRLRLVDELTRGRDVWHAFVTSRCDSSGCMDRKDFGLALETTDRKVSSDEITSAIRHFDLRGDGRVSFAEFRRFVEAGSPELKSSAAQATSGLRRLQELTKKCIALGVDYRAAFDRHDPEYTGIVSRAVFRQVLYELRADLSEADVAELEERFRGPGAFDVLFLEMLHSAAPGSQHGGDVWRHEEKLRQLIKKRFQWWIPGKLRKAFKHFDRSRQGTVGEADLSSGLRALKFQLSAEHEHELFSCLDMDGDGKVEYVDLVVLVRDPHHRHVAHRLRSELNKNQVSPSVLYRMLEDEAAKSPQAPGAAAVVGSAGFGRVLSRAGCRLSDDEVRRLTFRFDPAEDGSVAVDRVMRFVVGGAASEVTSTSQRVPAEEPRQAKKAVDALDPVATVLQRELRALGRDARDVRGFESIFKGLDPRATGVVETRDFRRSLVDLGMDLSDREMRLLVARIDVRGEGVSDYTKFIRLCEDAAPDGGQSLDSVLRELGEEMRQLDKSKQGRLSLRRAFDKVDRACGGELEERHVGEGFDAAGMDLNRATVSAIFNHLAEDGRVRPRDVLDFAEEALARQRPPEKTGASCNSSSLSEFKGFVQRAVDSGLDLLDIFEHFDTNRSGEINEEDFFRGLTKLNLSVSRAEARTMMDDFPGQRGRIKYRDFIRSLKLPREPLDDVGFLAEVRRVTKKMQPNFRRLFHEIDEAGHGVLDRRDFKRALEQMGFDLPGRDMRELVQYFDKNGDGLISYQAFIDFAEGSGKSGEGLATGMKVEARFAGKARYYPGVIRLENRDGTFDIAYDDGEREHGVAKEMIRAAAKDSGGGFEVDDAVEALYKGKGAKWYAGRISRVNKDGTCDIRYDDGDKEDGALERNIRRARL